MAETYFTPGPWNLVWYGNEQYPYPLSILADEDGAWVTRGGTVSSKPNANLIAAAPDLYAALEALLSKVDYENPGSAFEADSGCLECTSDTTPNRYNTGPCAQHRAIAALKKARGET